MPRSIDHRYDLLRTRLERFTRMLHGRRGGRRPRRCTGPAWRPAVSARCCRSCSSIRDVTRQAQPSAAQDHRPARGRCANSTCCCGLMDELHETRPLPESGARARRGAAVGDDREHARARLLAKVPIDELRRVAAQAGQDRPRPQRHADRGAAGTRGARGDGPSTRASRVARRRSRRRSPTPAPCISPSGCTPSASRSRSCATRSSWRPRRRPSGRRPICKQLRRVQDVLGRLHDLQVLIDRAREVQASLDAARPQRLAGARRARRRARGRLPPSARPLHARSRRAAGVVRAVSQERMAERARSEKSARQKSEVDARA